MKAITAIGRLVSSSLSGPGRRFVLRALYGITLIYLAAAYEYGIGTIVDSAGLHRIVIAVLMAAAAAIVSHVRWVGRGCPPRPQSRR
jgi:hypothetical protein